MSLPRLDLNKPLPEIPRQSPGGPRDRPGPAYFPSPARLPTHFPRESVFRQVMAFVRGLVLPRLRTNLPPLQARRKVRERRS